mgnify:CR=1 FL=1
MVLFLQDSRCICAIRGIGDEDPRLLTTMVTFVFGELRSWRGLVGGLDHIRRGDEKTTGHILHHLDRLVCILMGS